MDLGLGFVLVYTGADVEADGEADVEADVEAPLPDANHMAASSARRASTGSTVGVAAPATVSCDGSGLGRVGDFLGDFLVRFLLGGGPSRQIYSAGGRLVRPDEVTWVTGS